jgi:8-hydroxy-5-deazaflavin:NADPH oxidoreductase
MKIAIFGTGSVGQALASRLAGLSHEVSMGTRNIESTIEGGKVNEFLTNNASVTLKTFAEAAQGAEMIVLATLGTAAQSALEAAGDISGKVVLDISNPLDFSKGFPPTLFLSNDTSLGEVLQAKFPTAYIVKSLNTMYSGLMINPRALGEDSTVFVSGNDADAKTAVKEILASFGWKESEILDLGDITTARGTESLLPVWLRIFGATQNGFFNFKVATGK